MYEAEILSERLALILEALERVPRRFSDVNSPSEFLSSEEGREHLDSISMVLLSVGEAFRQIDEKTGGEFLKKYPEIPWRGVIGMRHVLAHDYFGINEEVIFNTCKKNVPPLIEVVKRMLKDLGAG